MSDTENTAARLGLPSAGDFAPLAATAPSTGVAAAGPAVPVETTDDGHNAVLEALVKGDQDIQGHVAYSIYEQHKRDWLNAFRERAGRSPTTGELQAYLVGEQTPRRLAAYRHLAAASIAGRGPGARGIAGGGGATGLIVGLALAALAAAAYVAWTTGVLHR